ncbi:PQQ-dependent sugar dehydrogenase [Micromonospora sp. 4G55]|uniref:PQQ-dependent sugar dehydrogenase n=1 Tax=Micromonospora sp. 4G55 TaxID=2806102 RepID=UPI001A3BB26F|nr:PQQ-dependent sugar dehydrogenase [Micromonospora sp. 4G55]MBM0257505.1 PQQ-dependent sugar dehydrogenase [Micromonospora sp. 4G55]
MSRVPQRRLLVAATALLTALATAVPSAALAHPGHPHPAAEPAPPQPAAVAAAVPPTSGFEKITLDSGLTMGEPIELAVLPDGKVLYINRGTSAGGGQVRLFNPATRSTTVALTLALDARFEDGLIGVTTHPNFATNRWVYLFYSPKVTPLVNRISRFTFNPATLVLDPASEDVLIEWPTERDLCCHSAGSMSWDTGGNLYFAVGDNTNSGGDSAGMAPIDERTTRNPQYDAQRTSGNTNDLRGKINRIHPENDGSYTIPSGNLFPVGTAKTRPEIYVMGVRNPYRIWVDRKAGNTLYWGEVGPDAGADLANRGPPPTTSSTGPPGPATTAGPTAAARTWRTTTGTSRRTPRAAGSPAAARPGRSTTRPATPA